MLNTDDITAKTKPLREALQLVHLGKAVIVDVRESAEYSDINLEGSINIPSVNFSVEDYRELSGQDIILMCQTGNRVKNVYQKLTDEGLEDIYISDTHIAHLNQVNLNESTSGWTVDRQFRMTLGVLLLIFLIGFFKGIGWLIAIPIILSSGLIITSIIDKCYMRIAISMLPWNREKRC